MCNGVSKKKKNLEKMKTARRKDFPFVRSWRGEVVFDLQMGRYTYYINVNFVFFFRNSGAHRETIEPCIWI